MLRQVPSLQVIVRLQSQNRLRLHQRPLSSNRLSFHSQMPIIVHISSTVSQLQPTPTSAKCTFVSILDANAQLQADLHASQAQLKKAHKIRSCHIWGEATTDTRIGKMSVYFLCGICGSKTLQTSFKMRERSRARFSEQAMVRGLETWGNGRFTNRTCLLNTSTLPKEASSQDHQVPTWPY